MCAVEQSIVADVIGMRAGNAARRYIPIAIQAGSRAMNLFAQNAENKITTKAREYEFYRSSNSIYWNFWRALNRISIIWERKLVKK